MGRRRWRIGGVAAALFEQRAEADLSRLHDRTQRAKERNAARLAKESKAASIAQLRRSLRAGVHEAVPTCTPYDADLAESQDNPSSASVYAQVQAELGTPTPGGHSFDPPGFAGSQEVDGSTARISRDPNTPPVFTTTLTPEMLRILKPPPMSLMRWHPEPDQGPKIQPKALIRALKELHVEAEILEDGRVVMTQQQAANIWGRLRFARYDDDDD